MARATGSAAWPNLLELEACDRQEFITIDPPVSAEPIATTAPNYSSREADISCSRAATALLVFNLAASAMV